MERSSLEESNYPKLPLLPNSDINTCVNFTPPIMSPNPKAKEYLKKQTNQTNKQKKQVTFMKWIVYEVYLIHTLAIKKLAKNSQEGKQTRIWYDVYFSKKKNLPIFRSTQTCRSRLLINVRRQRHI